MTPPEFPALRPNEYRDTWCGQVLGDRTGHRLGHGLDLRRTVVGAQQVLQVPQDRVDERLLGLAAARRGSAAEQRVAAVAGLDRMWMGEKRVSG